MIKIKFDKLILNHIHILALILLILISIFSTNYYSSYKKNQIEALENIIENIYLKKTIDSFINSLKPRFETINYIIGTGDTFEKILREINVPINEKKKVLKKISKFKFINKLYKNQKISFKVDRKNPIKILEFSVQTSKTKTINFSRNTVIDDFEWKEIEKNLKQVIVFKEAEITKSLYSSAIDIGIQPNVIIDFARIYGFQVDFQRDIWKNDSFQLVYETFLDGNGKILETGNIIYANLILQGRENPLYIFKNKKDHDHFDQFGKSIKKSLMKTPINGARLSSSFGIRKHPILGFNKMHRGTDFAAPMGTPIMASGDGKIVRARWCGGGGNCVKIKHNSTYSTVYAHMSKFGRNIKEGIRVKQGQIIGYVGSTGMSTGPHLHYEVIENGIKINSQKLKLPSGKILKGKERELFEIEKIKINVLKSELIAKKI
jgi:murein DD-endopeptidase MepM/ murein hydrolase activator NlpD